MKTPGSESIDPSRLKPAPIRHKSLPDELLGRIEAVYDVVGPYLGVTLEQFEITFMRDSHPEEEVAIWCSIIAAWIAYHGKYLANNRLPADEEKKLLGALLSISTGVDDLEALGVSAGVGTKLLACYEAPGKMG